MRYSDLTQDTVRQRSQSLSAPIANRMFCPTVVRQCLLEDCGLYGRKARRREKPLDKIESYVLVTKITREKKRKEKRLAEFTGNTTDENVDIFKRRNGSNLKQIC